MRVRAGAVAAAGLLAVAGWLGASVASAEPQQIPPATTVPATTDPAPVPTTAPGDLLVPGETTAPPATTAGAPTSARPEPQTQDDNQDSDAGRTVWMAIIGLLVVAVLILILTVLYARHTKPGRRRAWADDGGDEDEDRFTPTAARSVFGDSEHDEQTFWWAED